MQNARSRHLSMTLFLGEKRCLVLLVGENEVVVDWRSCIRRSKNSVHLILLWDHLENRLYCFVCLILGLGPLAVLYSYVEISALFLGKKRCLVLLVGENEVVVDWRSCIRRSKNNGYLILVWDHLEKELYCIFCLFV